MHILTAVMTGILVLLAGNVPWAGFGPIGGLLGWNLSAWTLVPWAIVPMALYLFAYWRFIKGGWGVSDGRLVRLPASAPITTPPEMPVVTAVLLLAMASVVAGVTEEAAFRGYMQSLIERHHGVVIAILVNGMFFGLLHFGNHPTDVLMMLPYYVAVSAVYGGLTWAADSILPALVLHAAGDVVVLTRWWVTGLPEWQVAATPPPLVWDAGLDPSFVTTTLAAVALAALTAWAYKIVRNVRGQYPQGVVNQA